MQMLIEQVTHVVASVSEPSNDAKVSKDHAPYFCQS